MKLQGRSQRRKVHGRWNLAHPFLSFSRPPRIGGGHGVVIKGIVENNKMKINSASSRAAAMMHRRVQYAWSCLRYRPEFLLRRRKREEKKCSAAWVVSLKISDVKHSFIKSGTRIVRILGRKANKTKYDISVRWKVIRSIVFRDQN